MQRRMQKSFLSLSQAVGLSAHQVGFCGGSAMRKPTYLHRLTSYLHLTPELLPALD